MNIDDPNDYGATWYSATRAAGPPRPRLNVELDIEVCVIGAGLAGLTVAREVARLGGSVAVLEAQGVAWAASGRNAGVVVPGFSVSASALVERVGLEHTRALWRLSTAGAEYVRSAAREIPGAALSETGWLHVSRTDDPAAMAAAAALQVGEFGVAVEPWPADRVREVLRTQRYFHALHYPQAFSLHPLNYALGLAAAAEAAGVRIFEDTPVIEIDPAGVRKRVVTKHSRVRAGHVVLAGNVHLPELAPQFSRTLTPLFGSAIATAPLGEALHEAIRFPGAVSDSDFPGQHHRATEDGRLLWSGRGHVSWRKSQGAGAALLRQVRRTYPQLRGAKAEYAWTGATGNAVHGMPQIGEISPGLWLLSGFGGHGLNTTAMAGEAVARAIVEGDRTWEMFTPFALVWAGGEFGRRARQLSGWARSTRESVAAQLARLRERQRRRAEAAKAAKQAKVAAAMAPVAGPVMEPVFAKPVFVEVPVAEPRVAEPPAAVAPEAAPVAESVIEPLVEPVLQPIPEPAPEPVPVEPPAPPLDVITEGQSGAAAPPVPVDEPAQPPVPKRKRGKRRKAAGQPDGPPSGDGTS